MDSLTVLIVGPFGICAWGTFRTTTTTTTTRLPANRLWKSRSSKRFWCELKINIPNGFIKTTLRNKQEHNRLELFFSFFERDPPTSKNKQKQTKKEARLKPKPLLPPKHKHTHTHTHQIHPSQPQTSQIFNP